MRTTALIMSPDCEHEIHVGQRTIWGKVAKIVGQYERNEFLYRVIMEDEKMQLMVNDHHVVFAVQEIE